MGFIKAIDKFYFYFNQEDEVILHDKGTSDEFLYLREKNIIQKIRLDEIVYVESMGDNLTIHTQDRHLTNRCTISSIQKLLSENGFLRIHRSFIVSLNRITSFSPVSVYIGKKEFPIGTTYKNSVFENLDYKGFLNK